MVKRRRATATPRLRFPEFRSMNGWEEVRIGAIAQMLKGKGVAKTDVTANGERPCIRYGELYTRYGEVIDKVYSRTNAPVTDLFFSRRNDVIIPASGESKLDIAKASCVLLDGVALGSDLNVLRTNHNGVFLSYLLNGSKRFEIAKVAQGDSVVHLYPSQLQEICIATTELAEQNKIAACLASLDEVIATQGCKIEALKAHKRGLMQQLFPREGETRPGLRFPEFRDAPDWEVKIAGNLFANRKEDGESGLPIYSVTMNDGMIPRASLDRDFYDIEEPAGNKKACKGDIAYNMMRMWQGAQGVAAEDCMVSPAYVVLSPLVGTCSDFFAYLLKLPHSLDLLIAHSRGLTKDRLRLYFDDFARIPLLVPGYEEQRRIAQCFLTLDSKIAVESRQLAALKTHKKGLMQQLFPVPEGR